MTICRSSRCRFLSHHNTNFIASNVKIWKMNRIYALWIAQHYALKKNNIMNHCKVNTKLTVIESTGCMSGRRIFISKASISFVVSRLISIDFYVPGPLIFVATFLLDPSNLQKRVVASIQTTQSSTANDHQKRKKEIGS